MIGPSLALDRHLDRQPFQDVRARTASQMCHETVLAGPEPTQMARQHVVDCRISMGAETTTS
jgi:hypothetical protein